MSEQTPVVGGTPGAGAAEGGGAPAAQIVRRLVLRYIRPHARLVVIGVAVNALVAATTGALPWIIQLTVDHVFEDNNTRMLIILPILTIAVMTARGVLTYISNVSLDHVGQRIVMRIRSELITILARSDLSWLGRTHSGRLISSFTADAPRLQGSILMSIVNLTRNLMTVISLYAIMLYMDWRVGVIMLFILPVLARVTTRQGRRARRATAGELEETGRLSSIVSEMLGGIRVVKAYGREDHEIRRATSSIEHVLRHMYKGLRAKAMVGPVTDVLTGVGIAVLILYGGWQHLNGALTVGQFSACLLAVTLVYQPLRSVAQQQTVLQEGLAAAERLFAILDTERCIVDAPDAGPLRPGPGALRLEDVTFRYPGAPAMLNGICLDVQPGKITALVGPSGGGKSTILNLAPRFYDPVSGRVTIDGQDVRTVTLDSLRAASAIVTQDPVLFDDTIGANIAYGRPGASDDEIRAAARGAAAHDFICGLPQGYDTMAGEQGVRLSGGQKQRIAIARAMLKNAPLLLLDEATSALDAESEMQVRAAYRKLMGSRTTLVIAHQFATIEHADMIYVINAGRVAESGTHAELMARDGLYAQLRRAHGPSFTPQE